MTVEPSYVDNPPDTIELKPFARFNWKTSDSRDMYAEEMDEFPRAKHEAEWLSVKDGRTDRKAAIIHVRDHNRERWIERVGKHDLAYRPIRYSKPYDGFAHKFHPTDKSDPRRITYSVIAQNEDIADKMKEAELERQGQDRHDVIGELLGFPDCCRSFFGDVWVDNYELGLTDPMYEVACNTPSAEEITDRTNVRVAKPEAYTNVLWRYFGWSFITHIPCSFECEESVEIGEARHEIMKENGFADAAEAAYEWMDQPATWDGLKRIATIKNMHVTGTAGTSCYWDKKRVEWRREHFPQMKPVYTADDYASINA